MDTATIERPMAKKHPGRTGRPVTSNRNDKTARIDAGILFQASHVAGSKGITVAEYLSEILREPVGVDYANLLPKTPPKT